MGKTCSQAASKVLFPEYEIELEPEELEAGKEKSEAEVMKEYEELLRSGQVTHQNDDGEYRDAVSTIVASFPSLTLTYMHTHSYPYPHGASEFRSSVLRQCHIFMSVFSTKLNSFSLILQ